MSSTLVPPFYQSGSLIYGQPCECSYFHSEGQAQAYAAVHGGAVVQTSPAHRKGPEHGIWRVAIPVVSN